MSVEARDLFDIYDKDDLDPNIAGHAEIEELIKELDDYSDGLDTWLIPENEFRDYAEDYIDDMCGPQIHYGPLVIDWNATVENIKDEHNELNYNGRTYYYR